MVVLLSVTRQVKANPVFPVVSPGTPVCSGYWFHGYQSVGAIYTVGDSNAHGDFAIGGYLNSGCSTIDTI